MVANVGDSRCIVCSEKKGVIKAKALSRDHKPSVGTEAMRIRGHGGVIGKFQAKNGVQLGPLRVWVKNGILPGLAMTRSFGDAIASSIGVISEPGNVPNL